MLTQTVRNEDHLVAIVAIYRDDRPVGLLCAESIYRPFSEGQLSLTGYLARKTELYIDNSVDFAGFDENTTYYIDRILKGLEVDSNNLAHFLAGIGWKIEDNYSFFFLVNPTINLVDNEQYKFLSVSYKQLFVDALMIPYETGIAIIGHENDYYKTKNFQHQFGEMLKKTDLKCGISLPFSYFTDIGIAFLQCKSALKEGTAESYDENAYFFSAYYLECLIHSLESTQQSLKSLCNLKLLRWVKSDFERRKEYIRSLRVFLSCGNNFSASAEKLFIHRNTLMYRLERLEELLGLELKSLREQERLCLYLTCVIAEQ